MKYLAAAFLLLGIASAADANGKLLFGPGDGDVYAVDARRRP